MHHTSPLITTFATLAGAATGYTARHYELVTRLTDWADDQVALRPRRSPRFWLGLAVALVAVTVLWTVRPQRAAANRRAWREEIARREPPPHPRLASQPPPDPTLPGPVAPTQSGPRL